jgi:hypothetical protein
LDVSSTKDCPVPFAPTLPSLLIEQALLSGQPLTLLEAVLHFGYADLAKKKVTRLTRNGFRVKSRPIALPKVLARLEAALGAPVPVGALVRSAKAEFPIHVTEYFVADTPAQKQRDAVAALVAQIQAALANDPAALAATAALLKGAA